MYDIAADADVVYARRRRKKQIRQHFRQYSASLGRETSSRQASHDKEVKQISLLRFKCLCVFVAVASSVTAIAFVVSPSLYNSGAPSHAGAAWGCSCEPDAASLSYFFESFEDATFCQDHVPDMLRSSVMAHVNRIDAYKSSARSTGHSLNALFVGGPGTGKSWTISKLCEAMYGACCDTCRLQIAFEDRSVMDDSSVEARRVLKEETAVRKAAVKEHFETYKYGMVELDDVHYAPPGALDFLWEFVREGSIAANAMVLMSLNDQKSKDAIMEFMFDESRYLARDEIDDRDVGRLLLPKVADILTRESSAARRMVQDGLVDVTVPFLPMDRNCIQQCQERRLLSLARSAEKRGLYKSLAVDTAVAEHLATSVVQYDLSTKYGKGNVFAKSGCRFKDKGKPEVFCANQLSSHRDGSPQVPMPLWHDYFEHYDRDAQLTLKTKSGKSQCVRRLFRRAGQ